MFCPANPPAPDGYNVWKGNVPPELVQWAISLRDQVNGFPYGQTWTMPYSGVDVLARKDHHTWTWRNGVLVTGLCIPGITLYSPKPPGQIGLNVGDPLANPDGTEAVFGADNVPSAPATTDWVLVGVCGVLIAGVAAAVVLGVRAAGRAA